MIKKGLITQNGVKVATNGRNLNYLSRRLINYVIIGFRLNLFAGEITKMSDFETTRCIIF